MRATLAIALLVAASPLAAQQLEFLPAGSEYTLKCTGSRGAEGEFRWQVVENNDGMLRVRRADNANLFRLAPVWAFVAGDIYQELGTPQGVNRMTQLGGPKEGIVRLAEGGNFSAEYQWSTPSQQANRRHSISVSGPKRLKTEAFGEQDVFEIVDQISGSMHQMRREVAYSPSLKAFVLLKFRNLRQSFEQDCVLSSIKSP